MDYSDIEYRYSGGASNSTPANSIGGVRSSEVVPENTLSALSPTHSGISLVSASGCESGTGYIYYQSKKLTYKPPYGEYGPRVDCTGLGNVEIGLIGAGGPEEGVLVVSITEANLTTTGTSGFTVTRQKNKIWGDVDASTAAEGYVSYRCVYLTNTHGTESITKLSLYLLNDLPSDSGIYVAFDTDAGVGNGSTTGVAVAINTEEDLDSDLASLTFDNPTNEDDALEFTSSSIGPGNSIPIWIKRVVPAGSSIDVEEDYFAFAVKAYIGI